MIEMDKQYVFQAINRILVTIGADNQDMSQQKTKKDMRMQKRWPRRL